jgi:hypothetical protein
MLEVQRNETRRARLFRLLSVLSPGAGHVYARHTILGVALLVAWYSVIAGYVTIRVMPLTEVSSLLTPGWWVGLLVAILVLVWLAANRLQPDFGVALPRKRKSRRVRAGQGG